MTDLNNTSLYHEATGIIKMNNEAVKRKKSAMTLDFAGGLSAAKRPKGKLGVLASPDLNMLKLGSPELEKLIIQHNGMVTTTPTPTQILFPKAVTEEQEAYARGFMDALAELHKKKDPSEPDEPTQTVAPVSVVPAQRLTTLQTVPTTAALANQFMTTTTLPGSTVTVSAAPAVEERPSSAYDTSLPATVLAHSPTPISQTQYVELNTVGASNMAEYTEMQQHPRAMALKEEPQTVPNGYTPPMSPIDMDDQECMKTDRKRARNRVAARKCRYRKLERISRLEGRVGELKGQNAQLSQDAFTLKEQVAQLKQQIMEHVKSGCQIMVSSGIGSIL